MKKSMKVLSIIGVLAFFMLSNVLTLNAQSDKPDDNKKPKKTPEERTDIIVKKMKEKLVLREDQVPKVYDIILEREKQRDLDIAACQNDKEKMKQARIARFKKADDALKKVLDEKQYQALVEWRKEAKNNKKNNKTNAGPAPDKTADDIDN